MFTQENLKLVATILVIVGALNWLGVGLQNTNYVAQAVGPNAPHVFTAVGAAGVYLAYLMAMNYRATGKVEPYKNRY